MHAATKHETSGLRVSAAVHAELAPAMTTARHRIVDRDPVRSAHPFAMRQPALSPLQLPLQSRRIREIMRPWIRPQLPEASMQIDSTQAHQTSLA